MLRDVAANLRKRPDQPCQPVGLCRCPLFARSQLAFAGGRPRCRRAAAIPLSFGLGKGPRTPQGPPAGTAGRGASEDSPQRLAASQGRCPDPRVRAVGGDLTNSRPPPPPRELIPLPVHS